MTDMIMDMTEEQYFTPGWHGIHALLDFEKRGPLYFKMKHIDGEIESSSSDAFDVGKAAHKIVLEGIAAYESEIVVKPETYTDDKGNVKPWHGGSAVCKQWAIDHAQQTCISAADDAVCRGMYGALNRNVDAMRLLKSGAPEVVIRCVNALSKSHTIFTQIRIDWLSGLPSAPEAMVDYKTCASLGSFASDCVTYCYDRQAAFYQDMYRMHTGKTLPWYWIAQEKSKPYRSQVFVATPRLLDRAWRLNMELYDRVTECIVSDTWPMGTEGIHEVDVPDWILRRESNG